MDSISSLKFEFLSLVEPSPSVVHVILNRPKSRNALHGALWREIRECFKKLNEIKNCRCVILSGAGNIFCAGIDLMYAITEIPARTEDMDAARAALQLYPFIQEMQGTFNAIEACRVPVIAAVSGACVGAGVDMITACDIRLGDSSAWFSVKEIQIGMAADMGSLQRLPKVVGNDSWVRDVCLTGRPIQANEAKAVGLLSGVLPSRDNLMETALEMAKTIAAQSPVAVVGTKASLNFSREHNVAEGLAHIALWNAAMLQTTDLATAGAATLQATKGDKKSKVIAFSNL